MGLLNAKEIDHSTGSLSGITNSRQNYEGCDSEVEILFSLSKKIRKRKLQRKIVKIQNP